MLQKRSEPSLCALAKAQVHSEFQTVLNEFLETDGTDLEFLIIRYDREGKIQSISVDTQKVTAMRTNLMRSFLEHQKKEGVQHLAIPIGNLSKSPLFYGRGPSFQVKILPCEQIDIDITDSFISAGINQTLHQINLSITAEIEILLPTSVLVETVQAEIPLTKTWIVGDVPNLYPIGGLLS